MNDRKGVAFINVQRKQRQFDDKKNILDSIKETILDSNKIPNINIDIKEEGNKIYINYLNRSIRVDFINNFESVEIHFFLSVPDINNIDNVFKKVLVVESDKLGNVSCDEPKFNNQRYMDVHFIILDYILVKSCE